MKLNPSVVPSSQMPQILFFSVGALLTQEHLLNSTRDFWVEDVAFTGLLMKCSSQGSREGKQTRPKPGDVCFFSV